MKWVATAIINASREDRSSPSTDDFKEQIVSLDKKPFNSQVFDRPF